MNSNSFYTLLFLSLFAINITSQSSVLVEDYRIGTDGSVDDRIYQYLNTLTYEGTTLDGIRGVLQYDTESQEITEMITEEDLGHTIDFITSNTEELYIIGDDDKRIYRSLESDLSDLELRFETDLTVFRFRIYGDYLVIFEAYEENGEDKTNIQLVYPDNSVKDILVGLPGRGFDYSFTIIQNYILIAPEIAPIDGQTILNYSIDADDFVPITDIISGFGSCGLISNIFALNDNIVYYQCEGGNFMFETSTSSYIEYGDESLFLFYDLDPYIYYFTNNTVYRTVKATGEREILIENVVSFRNNGTHLVTASINGAVLDISLFEFVTQELTTHLTDLPSEGQGYRFTGFAVTSRGVHLTIYENQFDDGILAQVNHDEFNILDSLYTVTFNNRPVSYQDEIYYTHEDQTYGRELFRIDYEVSTDEEIIHDKTTISPNPTSGYFEILNDEIYVKSTDVLDVNGCLILSNISGNRVNLEKLTNGVYLVRIHYSSGQTRTKRVIKI